MKTIMRNEQAQAGVGTLIIFIAMVLVAAVAAAVLIQTSGVMQSKSTSTTKEAAAAIGENIIIDSVDGYRNVSASNIYLLNITIKVAAGGSDVDLTKLLVTAKSASKTTSLNYNTTTHAFGANTFGIVQMRGSSAMNTSAGDYLYGYVSSSNPSMTSGDLVKLVINAESTGANLGLQAKGALVISISPEKGSAVSMPMTLPAFGDSTSISIYP